MLHREASERFGMQQHLDESNALHRGACLHSKRRTGSGPMSRRTQSRGQRNPPSLGTTRARVRVDGPTGTDGLLRPKLVGIRVAAVSGSARSTITDVPSIDSQTLHYPPNSLPPRLSRLIARDFEGTAVEAWPAERTQSAMGRLCQRSKRNSERPSLAFNWDQDSRWNLRRFRTRAQAASRGSYFG